MQGEPQACPGKTVSPAPVAGDAVILRSCTGDAAPAALLERLIGSGRRIGMQAGQMLLDSGAVSDDVYVVLEGEVRVTLFSSDGREMVIRDQGSGDFFGELAAIDGGRRSTSIVATQPGALLVVPGIRFRDAVAGSPDAAAWFTAHLVGRVRSLTVRLFELSTLNVRSRLHSQLLRMCAAAGVADNRALIDPAPTHDVLATMIGTHREAVTRELSYLGSVGIVSLGRRKITVNDVTALASFVRRAAGADSGRDGPLID